MRSQTNKNSVTTRYHCLLLFSCAIYEYSQMLEWNGIYYIYQMILLKSYILVHVLTELSNYSHNTHLCGGIRSVFIHRTAFSLNNTFGINLRARVCVYGKWLTSCLYRPTIHPFHAWSGRSVSSSVQTREHTPSVSLSHTHTHILTHLPSRKHIIGIALYYT